MSGITTHVLDTTRGCPAAGIPVALDFQISERDWKPLGKAITDAEGRVRVFEGTGDELISGIYRLSFDAETYQRGFYPNIVVIFRIENPNEHYHVPLLLGTFGYTTYRGS
jgi:5-hydroxyisourate hydrolase